MIRYLKKEIENMRDIGGNENKYGKRVKTGRLIRSNLPIKLTDENMIIKVLEEKQSLLKKSAKVQVININELINYIHLHFLLNIQLILPFLILMYYLYIPSH